MVEYRLAVGVLGIIFDEDSEAEAKRQFDLFVQKSKNARSAEAGTSVTLFKNRNHTGISPSSGLVGLELPSRAVRCQNRQGS